MNTAGTHITADVWLVEMPAPQLIMDAIESALKVSGMTVVNKAGHEFDGGGMTSLWLLSASHFSVHTFPECGFIALDCYTCGDEGDPVAAVLHVLQQVQIERSKINIASRG
jgi:S-adenosylmethionine decarboxylase